MIERGAIPGTLVVHSEARLFNGPWSVGTARKACRCVLTERSITSGDRVYRPLTNGLKRYQRMLADQVDQRTLGAPSP